MNQRIQIMMFILLVGRLKDRYEPEMSIAAEKLPLPHHGARKKSYRAAAVDQKYWY